MPPAIVSIAAIGITPAGLRREVSGLDSRLSRLEGAVSATFFSRPPLVETAEHGD